MFIQEQNVGKIEKIHLMNSPTDLSVKFIRRIGTLVPDIHNLIIEQQIDLVVMGTHADDHSVWHSDTEKTLTSHHPPACPALNRLYREATSKLVKQSIHYRFINSKLKTYVHEWRRSSKVGPTWTSGIHSWWCRHAPSHVNTSRPEVK